MLYFPNSTNKRVHLLASNSVFIYRKQDFKTQPYIDVIFFGINHPVYPFDSKIFCELSIELVEKSPYFNIAIPFHTGKESIEKLKELCKNGKKIRHLVFYGHSGYKGFFVEKESGFYTDTYSHSDEGKKLKFTGKEARIKHLVEEKNNKRIVFDENAIVVLAGCNTYQKGESFANDLAKALQIPVVCTNQKIVIYHTSEVGEELLGIENKTFVALFYEKGEKKILDFSKTKIGISEAIYKINEWKKLQTHK